MVWKPHATVAAIIERDNKFLMIEEEVRGKLVLNQPAGHLDPDESLIQAVIRETLEETAWKFTPQAVTGVYLWKHPSNEQTFLRITFCGTCDNFDAQQTLDTGIIRTLWMTREELIQEKPRLRSPMVLQGIDDYLAGKRYPMDMLINVPSSVSL